MKRFFLLFIHVTNKIIPSFGCATQIWWFFCFAKAIAKTLSRVVILSGPFSCAFCRMCQKLGEFAENQLSISTSNWTLAMESSDHPSARIGQSIKNTVQPRKINVKGTNLLSFVYGESTIEKIRRRRKKNEMKTINREAKKQRAFN